MGVLFRGSIGSIREIPIRKFLYTGVPLNPWTVGGMLRKQNGRLLPSWIVQIYSEKLPYRALGHSLQLRHRGLPNCLGFEPPSGALEFGFGHRAWGFGLKVNGPHRVVYVTTPYLY